MEMINSIFTVINALGTVALAVIGYKQLAKVNKSLNDSNLMSYFEIEFELNRRKERVAELRNRSEEYLAHNHEINKDFVEKLHQDYEEGLENYFNVFDRLCYFILKEKLDEEDFRTEYREMLSETIKLHEVKFGPATRYSNMVKLNDAWKAK